jgi:hypothetical protein
LALKILQEGIELYNINSMHNAHCTLHTPLGVLRLPWRVDRVKMEAINVPFGLLHLPWRVGGLDEALLLDSIPR